MSVTWSLKQIKYYSCISQARAGVRAAATVVTGADFPGVKGEIKSVRVDHSKAKLTSPTH